LVIGHWSVVSRQSAIGYRLLPIVYRRHFHSLGTHLGGCFAAWVTWEDWTDTIRESQWRGQDRTRLTSSRNPATCSSL